MTVSRLARLAVDPVGDGAEDGARVVDHDDRQPGARRRPRTGRVGEHGDRAARDRVVEVGDAVRAGARQGRVQVTGDDLAGGQG